MPKARARSIARPRKKLPLTSVQRLANIAAHYTSAAFWDAVYHVRYYNTHPAYQQLRAARVINARHLRYLRSVHPTTFKQQAVKKELLS